MTSASDLGEILDHLLAIFCYEAGNDFFVQAGEKLGISGEVAAIEKRDSELDVIWIEAFALGKIAGGRTQLETQVPQFLRKTANRIFEFIFEFNFGPGVKEEDVDIGVGKKPAATEASGGDEREILGEMRIGGRAAENDFVPETLDNCVD